MSKLRSHPDRKLMDKLMPAIREFQALATKHGIGDVFQDNGGKLLQLVLTMDLTVAPGRGGADAADRLGRKYEMKSLNIDLSSSFTTHHHLNRNVLASYRKVGWLFAMYRGIELTTIYSMEPFQLEPLFRRWEDRLNSGAVHINNPKIPAALVMKEGELIYGEPPAGTGRRSAPPTSKPRIDTFEADE